MNFLGECEKFGLHASCREERWKGAKIRGQKSMEVKILPLRDPAEAISVNGGSMAGWLGGCLTRSLGPWAAKWTHAKFHVLIDTF